MGARIGVVTFPGSLDDRESLRAVALAGGEPVAMWHGDSDVSGVDAIILPGGFSYGDYLRSGAIARFAPIMEAVIGFARAGGPVLGICNGFQVLCESHLLPGALVRNAGQKFVCRAQQLTVHNSTTAWTTAYDYGQSVVIPVKNGDGRFVADEETLDDLEQTGRVVVRYSDGTPNGSMRNIAGISNAAGNVVGLMPHPEYAVEALTGTGVDGLGFFTSVLESVLATAR